MNMRYSPAIIFLGILLSSCGGTNPLAPSWADITGTTWKLQSIQQSGQPRLDIQNPERLTVTFGTDQRVSVRADCNVCGGGFERTGSMLELGLMACTKAFCGVNSPDTQFLNTLGQSTTVSLVDGNLTIASQDTVLTFGR